MEGINRAIAYLLFGIAMGILFGAAVIWVGISQALADTTTTTVTPQSTIVVTVTPTQTITTITTPAGAAITDTLPTQVPRSQPAAPVAPAPIPAPKPPKATIYPSYKPPPPCNCGPDPSSYWPRVPADKVYRSTNTCDGVGC